MSVVVTVAERFDLVSVEIGQNCENLRAFVVYNFPGGLVKPYCRGVQFLDIVDFANEKRAVVHQGQRVRVLFRVKNAHVIHLVNFV